MNIFSDRLDTQMFNADAQRQTAVIAYFLLVIVLSVPFWLLGIVAKIQLFPGVPASALMVLAPALAASMLVYRRGGSTAAVAFLKRAFDFTRIGAKVWFLPIIILMPSTMLLSYEVMRLNDLPLPAYSTPVLAAVPILAAFFLAALSEELGWCGFAIEPMQRRWGALGASLLLGSFWAAWHIVPLLQADRESAWIAWWSLFIIASRVLHTWIYNNTGKSVFAAALFHAVSNTSWQLFPNYGSHWEPRITGLLVALLAAVVVAIWGPGTLARFRHARAIDAA
jgi:membrane protease YdiL (CAAX protease family)